jgi:cytochrome c biogenesis protein
MPTVETMLYRTFTSTKTSVVILAAMSLFLLVGIVLPQDGDYDRYAQAEGKFLGAVKALRLLEVFSSPLFLIASFFFLANILICASDRIRKKANPFSVILHLGLILFCAGAAASVLFSFEGEIYLYPGEEATIDTSSGSLRLGLEEFRTELLLTRELDYPKKKAERPATSLRVALGAEELKYLPEDKYVVKDWKSVIVVDGARKTIEVNHPFTYEGVTFYQSSFAKKLDLRIEDKKHEVELFQKLYLPELQGELHIKDVISGVLYENGSTREITPVISLGFSPAGENLTQEYRVLLGSSFQIKDKTLVLENLREASGISYRYDPGVPYLWLASLLILLGMCVRLWTQATR